MIFFCYASYGQSIGYKQVNYVPTSEYKQYMKMPVTPALLEFSKRVKDQLKNELKIELKGLKKDKEQYELHRKELLKTTSIAIEGSLRAIFEIESLKVMSEFEALTSIYQFLDCWEKSNFKSTKKNFCHGCWEKHIEGERLYKNRYATIFE